MTAPHRPPFHGHFSPDDVRSMTSHDLHDEIREIVASIRSFRMVDEHVDEIGTFIRRLDDAAADLRALSAEIKKREMEAERAVCLDAISHIRYAEVARANGFRTKKQSNRS